MATIKKELGGALFEEKARRNCPYARFDLGVDGVCIRSMVYYVSRGYFFSI